MRRKGTGDIPRPVGFKRVSGHTLLPGRLQEDKAAPPVDNNGTSPSIQVFAQQEDHLQLFYFTINTFSNCHRFHDYQSNLINNGKGSMNG
jgi:hypothetical protein